MNFNYWMVLGRMGNSFFNFFIISLFLAIGYNASGQGLFLANQLSVEAGLSHPLNSFVYQDQDGLIWISSIDGLNCFDGKTVTVYKPDPFNPNAIKGGNIQSTFWEDQRANIWFSTEQAVNCYDRQQRSFKHFVLSSGQTQSLHHCAFFMEQKRFLWVASDQAFFKFDVQNITAQPLMLVDSVLAARYTVDTFPDGSVKNIYASFWEYQSGFEVFAFNQEGALIHRKKHDINNGKVRQIIPDLEKNNKLWILSDNQLIEFYTEASTPYIKHLVNEEELTAIFQTKERELLLGTLSGRILSYNPYSRNVQNIVTKIKAQEISYEGSIENLFATDNQMLWVSVKDEGLYFGALAYKIFHNIGKKQGLSEPIHRIFEINSCEYWLLGENFFFKINICQDSIIEESWMALPYSELIKDQRNQFWAVSVSGLYFYDQKVNNWEKKLFSGDFTAYMDAVASNNSLYIGGIQGAFVVNLLNLSKINFSDQPTYSLGYDNENRLWQGGDNYIQIWKQQGDGLEKLIRVQEIGDVNYFHEQVKNNLMWVGTSRGLFRFDLTSLQYELINEQTGIPNQYIQSITSDKNGALWVATNQGIVTFDPNERPYHFINYTVQQGLGANEFRMGAVLHDSDGRLWFAHKKGVEIFHPDSVRLFGQAPRLALTGLKIHDKPWEGHLAQGTEKALELSYLQNTLQFNLAALEYTNPQLNQFKVRLLGIDTAWTHLGTQNFITYPNLSHGHYTFQFTAANAEGLWQETPYSLSIRITPPYWRTWWFYTLMALLFVGAVYGLFRYREIQRLKQEKLRLRIARDLHDEMGSTLSSISILSEAALHGLQADIDRTRFSLIGERSRQVMEAMSDIVWSVNPKNDNMEKVLQRMKEFAVEILEAKDITLHFDTRQGLGKLELPMEQRKDFYLLFKEAINNAAKYSQASDVWVTLNEEGGHLALHIRDNGCGFDIQQIKRGNGLWNMQQRAERMGARFDLQSGVGEGTSIKITLH